METSDVMNENIKTTLNNLASWYFTRKSLPYWAIALFDSFITFVCIFCTYYGFWGGEKFVSNFWPLMSSSLLYTCIYVVFFRIRNTYTGILRFSSFVDLMRVGQAVACGCAASLIVMYGLDLLGASWPIFLSSRVVITSAIIAIMLLGALRVAVKVLYDVCFGMRGAVRCYVYGVRDAGIGIAKSIRSEKPARFNLCGFVTDEEGMGTYIIMGKKVHTLDDQLIDTMLADNIKALIVSPLRARDFRHNQEFQDKLIDAGIKIYMHEGEQEFNTDTNVKLKEVSVEDLLPRDEIEVDLTAVENMLHDQTVLITGAAGSIGSEIVRQVASFGPKQLVLIDQAETPMHDIRLMMHNQFPDIPAETIVTSITVQEHMEQIFQRFRPAFVFHAAAYKHVPMMEDNPGEAIRNNVWGTKVIADLSVKYGVRKFVMISTDKAVNPTNVMGCSKRLCEIYVQSLNNHINSDGNKSTQFVTTRFGNVLGSNGSVIPIFREQLKNGGPITVTHPDIIRFFMLIPEACKLVLEAGTMGEGGEIFVFDMGKPVKIADLARRMIHMSGATNVEIKFTGLRDGEKLYEEVLSDAEGTLPSFNKKIRIAQVREYNFDKVKSEFKALFDSAYNFDDMAIVRKMKEMVPEYISNNSKYSVIDEELANRGGVLTR